MVRLENLATKGIKNLTHECVLPFGKKGKVKAVYGVNGAGKTALILSARVLKMALLQKDYTVTNRRPLLDIINKSLKRVYISAAFSEGVRKCFYEIELRVDGGGVVIVREVLHRFTRGAQKTVVYAIEEGNVAYLPKAFSVAFLDETKNLLSQSSFSALIYRSETLKNALPKSLDAEALTLLWSFAKSLQVYLMPGDLPQEPYKASFGANIPESIRNELREAYGDNRHRELDFIMKSDLNRYQEASKRLGDFIRLFKPELKGIKITKHEMRDDVLGVERIFEYPGGVMVNSYLESTGIRALVSVFPFIQAAVDGQIVFIDEMDANINGIFLSSLIEYLIGYCSGQICFTSHNTHLMSALNVADNQYGVCFLSPSKGVKAWVKNGHYDAEGQWVKGFVPGFAFNFEPLDFYGIFPPMEANEDA